jgi:DNA-directed RNA polymerase specialized sigma24 family protein
MTKAKTDNERILATLGELSKRIEDLFILEASLAGLGQREIRAMLGIELSRVTKIAKLAKKDG